MLTFFYWIGIFVISFSILLLIKSEKDDADDLPLSKEQLNYIAIYIAIIGTIILAISLQFLNYRHYKQISDEQWYRFAPSEEDPTGKICQYKWETQEILFQKQN